MIFAQEINFPNNIFEISIEDYQQKFSDSESHQLLDVREPWEIEIAHLQNYISIPLGSLENKQDQLSQDKWIVVYCHHGIRSLRACHLLRAKGFDKVLSLKGGIHRWSHIIDPNVSIY